MNGSNSLANLLAFMIATVLICFSFNGCGNEPSEQPPRPITEKQEMEEPVPPPPKVDEPQPPKVNEPPPPAGKADQTQ